MSLGLGPACKATAATAVTVKRYCRRSSSFGLQFYNISISQHRTVVRNHQGLQPATAVPHASDFIGMAVATAVANLTVCVALKQQSIVNEPDSSMHKVVDSAL